MIFLMPNSRYFITHVFIWHSVTCRITVNGISNDEKPSFALWKGANAKAIGGLLQHAISLFIQWINITTSQHNVKRWKPQRYTVTSRAVPRSPLSRIRTCDSGECHMYANVTMQPVDNQQIGMSGDIVTLVASIFLRWHGYLQCRSR